MTNYSDYINYFRALADLLLANTPSHRTFYEKGLDEFLNTLTIDGNYPAMLMGRNEFRLTDTGFDNVKKERSISIVIFDHVDDIQDYDKIAVAFDNSENVIDKMYNKLRADKNNPQCADFSKYIDLSNIEVLSVENEGDGNYGYLFELTIQTTHNTNII